MFDRAIYQLFHPCDSPEEIFDNLLNSLICLNFYSGGLG